jgi:hypothetical protein
MVDQFNSDLAALRSEPDTACGVSQDGLGYLGLHLRRSSNKSMLVTLAMCTMQGRFATACVTAFAFRVIVQ